MRFLEVFNHVPYVVLYCHQLSLDVLYLIVLLFCQGITLLDLLGQFISNILFFFFGELSQLFMTLNLLFNLLVLLFNHVDFRVDLIHVVIKGIILLVSLDEGGNNFLDGSNTSLLLDLVESIFNDVHISNIHVHQILLFLVVVGPLLQSQL